MDTKTLKTYIIQYVMNRGAVPEKELIKICRKVAEDDTAVNIVPLITQINSKISAQSFAIELVNCEVTSEPFVIWCNTKSDELCTRQKHFSKAQLEYFQAILTQILGSSRNRILYKTALNIASSLTQRFSLSAGEQSLEAFMKGGYFVESDEKLYLGVRTIVEYRPFLQVHAVKRTCDLCNELAFKFEQCKKCKNIFHGYCIEKYTTLHQRECPKCKKSYTPESDQSDEE